MNKIYQNISHYNPWHTQSQFKISTAAHKRDLFATLVSTLNQQISISISGLRRTGKTTLQQQLINHYLKQKISSKRILYYIFSQDDQDLAQVLKTFFNLHSRVDYYKQNFYLFLDELQHVKGWQDIVKIHFDLNHRIRFIVSGSASVYLHQDTMESLAGRMIDYQLSPLLFNEYLSLKNNLKIKNQFGQLIKLNLNDKQRLLGLKQQQAALAPYQGELDYYLKYGEFPKLINTHNDEFNQQYLQSSIIDKILKKDIKIFEITKLRELASLYQSTLSATGQVFSLNKAASELELSYQSVTKYLQALKLAFLVDVVKNKLSSIRSQEAALKKVFSTTNNLICLQLNISSPLHPSYLPFKGHLIETHVYHHLKPLGKVYYYNHQEKEIDFILETQDGIIPIEVKASSRLRKTTFNHLWWYLDKKKLSIGYLLYDGEIKLIKNGNKKIFLLPWWII